jgi:hypothetical protein
LPSPAPSEAAADTTTSSAIPAHTTEAYWSEETWAEIPVDVSRSFIYGPRLGRLYLVSAADAQSPAFHRALGLRRARNAVPLADPADSVAHTAITFDESPRPLPACRGLRLFYLALRTTRGVFALRFCARVVRRLAKLSRGDPRATSTDIAGLVHAVERGVAAPDCYPRALLTLYLALRLRKRCVLTVGVLAPTRKMHAWCSIGSELPYEPVPEHYLYQPVWSLTLRP